MIYHKEEVKDMKHIAIPKSGILFGSCDLGKCYINNFWLFITWGRNLTSEDIKYINNHNFVQVGEDSFEIILNNDEVKLNEWYLDDKKYEILFSSITE